MPTAELLPLTVLGACCSPLTKQPISADDAASLARVLKAVADPARLRLVSMVAAHQDARRASAT